MFPVKNKLVLTINAKKSEVVLGTLSSRVSESDSLGQISRKTMCILLLGGDNVHPTVTDPEYGI